MTTDVLIRGNLVEFSTTFFGVDGLPVVPDSAVVEIKTATLGVPTVVELTMTEVDGMFSALWDTSAVDAGIVFWCIRATGPAAADQGQFSLEANWANA